MVSIWAVLCSTTPSLLRSLWKNCSSVSRCHVLLSADLDGSTQATDLRLWQWCSLGIFSDRLLHPLHPYLTPASRSFVMNRKKKGKAGGGLWTVQNGSYCKRSTSQRVLSHTNKYYHLVCACNCVFFKCILFLQFVLSTHPYLCLAVFGQTCCHGNSSFWLLLWLRHVKMWNF